MDFELLVAPVDVGFNAVSTALLRKSSGSGCFSPSYRGSVVLPQSRGLVCGACGTAARFIGWPRSPLGASASSRLHGYARAPRSVGRWRSGSAAPWLSAEALMSWLVPVSPARESSVLGREVTAKGSASGGSAEQWTVARVCLDPRVGKCRPRCRELLRALFEHGVIKFRKRPVIIVESLLPGGRIETNASSSTRAFQTLLSRRQILSRSHGTILRTGERRYKRLHPRQLCGYTSGVLRHGAA